MRRLCTRPTWARWPRRRSGSPILQRQLEEGGRACAQGVQRQLLSWLRRGNNPCTQVVLGIGSQTGKGR